MHVDFLKILTGIYFNTKIESVSITFFSSKYGYLWPISLKSQSRHYLVCLLLCCVQTLKHRTLQNLESQKPWYVVHLP